MNEITAQVMADGLFTFTNMFYLSGAIVACWVVGTLLFWVGVWAWSWVDDRKEVNIFEIIDKARHARAGKNPNVLINGWEEVEEVNDFWKYRQYDNSGVEIGHTDYLKPSMHDALPPLHYILLPYIVVSIVAPPVLLLCYMFYDIAAIILLTTVLAYILRAGRRHQKLFNKHVKDKDAHNGRE